MTGKRESHFDDERFIRLLELTGTDMSDVHQDTDTWLNGGKDKSGLSVRKLSPENYIVEEEDGRLVYLGGWQALEIPVFQDGTTSIHRAKTFLESCAGVPPRDGQITRIIVEELSAMYAENKSPRIAAEIIDSRVQLYLDEQS